MRNVAFELPVRAGLMMNWKPACDMRNRVPVRVRPGTATESPPTSSVAAAERSTGSGPVSKMPAARNRERAGSFGFGLTTIRLGRMNASTMPDGPTGGTVLVVVDDDVVAELLDVVVAVLEVVAATVVVVIVVVVPLGSWVGSPGKKG